MNRGRDRLIRTQYGDEAEICKDTILLQYDPTVEIQFIS